MLKKYNTNRRFRRLIILAFIFVLTISLTACSNTYNRYPVGNLNVDEIYASIGNESISVGELWEELRYSTSTLLTSKLEKVIIQTYIDEIEEVMNGPDSDKKTDYTEDIKGYAINAVFGVTEEEELDDLTSKEKKLSAEKYAADLFLNNAAFIEKSKKGEIDQENLKNELLNADFTSVYEFYYENLAKKLFARAKLEKDIIEHDEQLEDDEDPYYSNSEIVSKFKTEYQDTGDVKAIIIRFMNDNEVNTALRAFGIKTFKNSWYYIPGDLNSTFLEYTKHYDDTEIKTGVSMSNEYWQLSTAYGEGIIALIFTEIYKFIYTYRDPLLNPNSGSDFMNDLNNTLATSNEIDHRKVTQSILDYYDQKSSEIEDAEEDIILENIIAELGDNKYTNYTSEELNDINSSLKSYVYTTLNVPYEEVEADQTYSCYTISGRSYGDYYYLVFKLDQETDEYMITYELEEKDDIFSEDEDGNDFIDPALYPDLVEAVIEKLKEDEVNDTYISNAITEAKKDIKLQIYDTILEITYSISNSDYSRTHKKAPDKNTLAKITYDDVDYFFTIDEAYKSLEATTGSSTAVDLLSKKIIKDTEYYKNIDKEDEKLYEDNLKYTLAMFANDQYTSYGYPASMGKYNFMLVYYRSSDIKTIIQNYYKVNAAMSYYVYNYENDLLLEQFVYYTEKAVENYMSISASALLVYVDRDEDGSADKDFNWQSGGGEWVKYEDAAKELINLILKYVEASTENHTTALGSIVEEYNSSSRFDNGLCKPRDYDGKTEYDPTGPECTWAKYRRLGLYISVGTYDGISNTSTDAEISENFKERLYEIYKDSDLFTKEIPSSQFIDYDGIAVETVFDTDTVIGYNFLIVTSASLPSKFTYNHEDFENAKFFENIPFIINDEKIIITDVLSNGDSVSKNQIKLYIYEYLSTSTTDLLPPEIVDALSSYFNPVLTRYTASATQRELLLRFLFAETNSTLAFAQSENGVRFEQVRILNQKVEDNFMADDDPANNFAGWWDNIFVGGAR